MSSEGQSSPVGRRWSRLSRRDRLARFAAGILLVLAALEGAWIALVYVPQNSTHFWLAMDYEFYRDIGQRWVSGEGVFLPHQLAGPYTATTMVDVLYPPPALLLFAPLVFLPAFVWWAVPAVTLVFVLTRWQPSGWALLVVAALMLYPSTLLSFALGNTSMWIAAALAAALQWGWTAPMLAIKPTFAPLALLAARHRSAWVATLALLLVSIAMLPLWLDYVVAMQNATIPWNWALRDVPLVLVPLVAWIGRNRQHAGPHGTGVSLGQGV